MELASLQQLNAERAARRAVILLTDLETGAGRIVREGEAMEGEAGEAIASKLKS